jgi:ethanolamine utilization cobalamin adenosyltransferase
MKEAIEELIKDYQRKIGFIQKLIKTRKLDGKLDAVDMARLTAKRGVFESVVHDLKTLLKDEYET